MTMTEGQKQVWAARYERVQHEHLSNLMAEWMALRTDKSPSAIPRDQMVAMFQESVRVAVEQANGAVLSMSALPPPDGQQGVQLREMLGIAEPLRLAAPEGFPELMDYSLPPPGWMFPEGCNDVVHALPSEVIVLADSPRVDRSEMTVNYPGWGHMTLFDLPTAWRVHMETNDPPGYEVRERQENEREHAWKVRLLGQLVWQWSSRAECRAFAWRCLEHPQHVLFCLKLGRYVDKNLSEILGWSDAQLEEAMAYIQAMSSWKAARPSAPPHLC